MGRCESGGACSVLDNSCPSGRRYDPTAGGALPRMCVSTDDGGVDANSEMDASADGDTDAGGCEIISGGDAGYGGNRVLVPGGPFQMGWDPNATSCVCGTCNPLTTISLPDFEIDEMEVTQAAYAACMQSGACTLPSATANGCTSTDWDPVGRANRPVVCVDWTQARAYCEAAGTRLPSEAEWEKAARGTDARPYPWGLDSPDLSHANYSDTGATSVVGSHPLGKSPYCAFDMAGNAWEWVDLGSGSTQAVHGGSFKSGACGLVTAYRSERAASNVGVDTGFRCAKGRP